MYSIILLKLKHLFYLRCGKTRFCLVEAAFANTTIISSNCNNGPAEILEKGKNGFLYKSNNKEDFLKIFEEFKKTDPKIIYKKN